MSFQYVEKYIWHTYNYLALYIYEERLYGVIVIILYPYRVNKFLYIILQAYLMVYLINSVSKLFIVI